jgi:hypothetical protein
MLALVAVLAVATSAVEGEAIDSTPKTGTPVPIPVSSPSILGSPATACVTTYTALLPTGTSYLPLSAAAPAGGPYLEYADDVHLIAAGALCEFSLTYFTPLASVDLAVTFYANNAEDNTLGDVVAGPFALNSLPGGLNTITVSPGGPNVPFDMWFSISSPQGAVDAGLVIGGVAPTVGVSHDLFLHVPALSLVFFGGPPNPLANFNIEVKTDGTVPTEESTWGQIKSLYQD